MRLEFRSSHHIKGEERYERGGEEEEKERQLKVAVKANSCVLGGSRIEVLRMNLNHRES